MKTTHLLLAISLALAGYLGHGCVNDGTGEKPRQGPVLDDTVLAFLSKARAAHHAADLHERSGDLEGAIRDLASITGGPRPQLTPEVSEVLADAFARTAEIKSRTSELDGALRDVDAGLDLAKDDTHFRGHLLEVRGVVFERQYDALVAAGQPDAAAVAKEKALDAFEAAIDVQERVIQKALGALPAGSPTGATSAAP